MKVSVIMPTYNHENYISEAIDSVLNQTHQHFELIIINDGSSDGTENKILNFKDSRIKYFYQDNQGAHDALNKGISLSTGDYVAILNSDDVYLPERLEKCIKYLEYNQDYSAVISIVEGIDGDGVPVVRNRTAQIKAWLRWYDDAIEYFKEDEFYPYSVSKNIVITTSNYFIRRKVLIEIGGFKGLRYAHDWDMLLRLSASYKIHLLNDVLLKYRIHKSSTIYEENSEAKVRFEVNLLIVQNVKQIMDQGRKIPDLINILRNNHYVSFESLFLTAISNYRYTKKAFFADPSALASISQAAAGREQFIASLMAKMHKITEGYTWLESQRAAWEKLAADREQVIDSLTSHMHELTEGNIWLESQRAAWENVAADREQFIASLTSHMHELTEGNAWLESQRLAWENLVSDREQIITRQNEYIRDLQSGNLWLESQRSAWESAAEMSDARTKLLATQLEASNSALNKIRSHWGMRFVNFLSKTKLF